MCCKMYVQILCFWFIEFRVVVSFKIRVGTSSIVYKLGLAKDYYIDGQNTQLIFFEKMTTGGGPPNYNPGVDFLNHDRLQS